MAAHAYWRLYVSLIGNGSTLVNVAELKFYDSSNVQIPTTGGSSHASTSFLGPPDAMAPNAFDGSSATVWSTFTGAPQWVVYHFAAPVDVAYFSITSGTGSQVNNTPIDFQLEYSDDGSTYTALYSYLGVSWAGANQVQTFTATNAATTSIGITWRLLITGTFTGGFASIAEWALYDGSLNPIATNKFSAFASTSVDGTGAPRDAFDGSGATAWKTYAFAPSGGSPQWIAYRFPTVQQVGKYCITNENANIGNSPTLVALQYSYDESTWTTVESDTFTWTSVGQTSCRTLGVPEPPTVTLPGTHVRGNIDWDQVGLDARHGNTLGILIQYSDGTHVTGASPVFLSDGTLTSGGGGGGGGTTVETPTGTINGTNASFALSAAPTTNSLQLSLNGVVQAPGTDFLLTGGTIIYTVPPRTGDIQIARFTT